MKKRGIVLCAAAVLALAACGWLLLRPRPLESFYIFDSAGTYTLRAVYTDLIGGFRAAVYPA